MAKVYPGVVGGPGITKKSPVPEERQRLSSGGPRELRPFPLRTEACCPSSQYGVGGRRRGSRPRCPLWRGTSSTRESTQMNTGHAAKRVDWRRWSPDMYHVSPIAQRSLSSWSRERSLLHFFHSVILLNLRCAHQRYCWPIPA